MPALDVVERRLVRLPVDGEHDALPAGDHRGGAVQVDAGLHRSAGSARVCQGIVRRTASMPRWRYVDEQPVRPRPPLGGVVVETDEQLSRSAGRLAGSMRNQYARARHQRRP